MTEKLPLSRVEVAADCFPRRFLLSASTPTGVFLRAVPIGEFVIGAATTTSGNASASGSKYKVFQQLAGNGNLIRQILCTAYGKFIAGLIRTSFQSILSNRLSAAFFRWSSFVGSRPQRIASEMIPLPIMSTVLLEKMLSRFLAKE